MNYLFWKNRIMLIGTLENMQSCLEKTDFSLGFTIYLCDLEQIF